MLEDFVYFSTLILSISLSGYYKKIDNIEIKRNYGAGLGIVIALLICGHHIYHTLLMVWGNLLILKCCDRRYIHILSLVYTWMYLLYLHIQLSHLQYVIWLHQNIALRLVGMAFEMHRSDKNIATSSIKIGIGDNESITEEPHSFDIIAYAFFFLGLQKGPYYRFKIFKEHLHESYGSLGDYRVITEHKLKKTLCCVVSYLLIRMKYSPQVFNDEKFYQLDADTRYLYNIPLLLMFCLQNQIIMLLSVSACTEAGFGIYPAICRPIPGHGPIIRHSLSQLTPEKVYELQYNFCMLKCFNNEKLLMGPRMTNTLRSWNMPSRYWFWAYIYKSLVGINKESRVACTFLTWTLWTGPTLQNIIISSTLWVHIHLESEYGDLYNTEGPMKLPWDIGFSIMRMFCLIYLTPCFVIKDVAVMLRYYNSIFWVFHGVLLVLIIGAIVTEKSRG